MPEMSLFERYSRTMRLSIWMCALILLAVLNIGWLDPVKDQVEEANRKFSMGDYEGALKDYTQAQTERPEEPGLHFNIGNVQVRKNNLQEAAREYQQSATSTLDRTLESKARYNLGNVLAMQGSLPEAIENYRHALRLNPDDEDAKHNLELAMLQLLQNPPQQQQQQEDQEDQEEDQEQPTPEQTQTGEQQQTPTPQEGEQDQQDQQQDDSTPTPQPAFEQGTETPTPSEQQQSEQDQQGEPTETPTPVDREQFERLLDRLDQKELEIRKKLQGTPPPIHVEKDW